MTLTKNKQSNFKIWRAQSARLIWTYEHDYSLYNIEDKITKYWLAETEGIFP